MKRKKLPQLKPWIQINPIVDNEKSYFAVDCQSGDGHILGCRLGSFAKKLDGKYDPYADPDYTEAEADSMVAALTEEGLVRFDRASVMGEQHIPLYVRKCGNFAGPARRCKLWSVVKWLNWLFICAAGPVLYTSILFLMDHIPFFVDPWATVAGGIAACLLVPAADGLVHAAVSYAYGSCIYEIGISLAGGFPWFYLRETGDRTCEKATLPIFLCRAAFDLFFGSMLTIWAILSGQAFALGIAIVSVLWGAGHLKFKTGHDGLMVLQFALESEENRDGEDEDLPEEEDCQQISMFDEDPPKENTPKLDAYFEAGPGVPFPAEDISEAFSLPYTSYGRDDGSVLDYITSNAMFAAVSLLLVRFCTFATYAVAVVLAVCNGVQALL